MCVNIYMKTFFFLTTCWENFRSVWYPPHKFLNPKKGISRCWGYADMPDCNECRKKNAEKQLGMQRYGDWKNPYDLTHWPLSPGTRSPFTPNAEQDICIQKNALPNAFDFWNSWITSNFSPSFSFWDKDMNDICVIYTLKIPKFNFYHWPPVEFWLWQLWRKYAQISIDYITVKP